LSQENSSLCGPASFCFTLVKIRPDIYVHLVDAPVTINQTIVNSITKQTQTIEDENEYDDTDTDTDTDDAETNDRILLDAFTWGIQKVSVSSRISSTQDARLSYFFNGFYGYVKVKL
jgi:hypothetical protein